MITNDLHKIPKVYHQFAKVFSDTEAQRLSKNQAWDHSIDLKPDAPATIPAKTYPLAPRQQ